MTYTEFDQAFDHGPFVKHNDNRAFLRELLAGVEADYYEVLVTYIKGVRTDGRPALNIYSGFTSGFRREEIAHLPADQPWRAQNKTVEVWGVNHPEHDTRDGHNGDSRYQPESVEHPVCQVSWLTHPEGGM